MIEIARRALHQLNRHPLARGSVVLNGTRLYAFTADRLLYLWLHRLGWMGREGFQEMETAICPGMTVVDVGANVGVFTSAFSRLVGPSGRVFSLEPAAFNLRALRKAKVANHWTNVEIFDAAASDLDGSMFFTSSFYNSGNNSLSLANSKNGAVVVPTVRLDTLLAGQRVDFLKIDVQGWEASVLSGALETLRCNRPLTVRLEIWPKGLRRAGSSVEEVLQILAQCGLAVAHPVGLDFEAALRKHAYFDLMASAP
jgi:FkbM family methyltransferase